MAKRQGLNATLSYQRGNKRYAIRLRIDSISYSVKQIAEETQGRMYRTFYPHYRTQAPFAINALLNGHEEYRTMNNWFAEYAKYALTVSYNDSVWPEMSVEIPTRNFVRSGIPVGTFEWGDKIGKALWTQTIQFETTKEPGDKKPKLSSFSGDQAKVRDGSSAYYYPSGNQLNANDKPVGTYATVPKNLSLQNLQSLVKDGTIKFKDADGNDVTEDALSSFLGLNVQVLGTYIAGDMTAAELEELLR